jgi:hypothetical protein
VKASQKSASAPSIQLRRCSTPSAKAG